MRKRGPRQRRAREKRRRRISGIIQDGDFTAKVPSDIERVNADAEETEHAEHKVRLEIPTS